MTKVYRSKVILLETQRGEETLMFLKEVKLATVDQAKNLKQLITSI